MVANIKGVPFQLGMDSAGFDLASAIHSGLANTKLYQENKDRPKRLAEELLANQLKNKMSAPYAENADRVYEADIGGREATAEYNKVNTIKQKMLNAFLPEKERAAIDAIKNPPLTGETANLIRLANSLPPGQQKDQVTQILQRKAEGTKGTQLTVDPKTGAISFTQGGSNRNNSNQQITTDENGNQTLIRTPTTPVNTAEQNASVANTARDYIAEHLEQPFIGSGSNFDVINDRKLYSTTTDSKKKEEYADKLVKAAVAYKMAPEYASFQLKAQNVPATVHALRQQEEAIKLGWPAALKTVVDNLPKELQERANKEHANQLKEVRRVRDNFLAQGLPIPLENKVKPGGAKGEMVGMNINGKYTFVPVAEALKMNKDKEVGDYSADDIKEMAKQYKISEEQVRKDIMLHSGGK